MYQSNFKNEKNNKKTVFEPGWHNWHVSTIEEKTAKSSGNPMFLVVLLHKETFQSIDVYMVAVEGKQWLLSQFIKACGVAIDQEGNCSWSEQDVLGKDISGFVQNEENDWTNREGETIKQKQSKISNFRLIDDTPEPPIEIEEEVIIPGEEEMF